jgi:hypothetical protein
LAFQVLAKGKQKADSIARHLSTMWLLSLVVEYAAPFL